MDRKTKIEILRMRKSPWISWGFRSIRRFQSLDPDQPHCYSKDELCENFSMATGLPKEKAEGSLHHLFALQPSLTYGKYGALCRKNSLLGIPGIISLSFEYVEKYFPPEWYITLQIPEKIIQRMIWSCWRYREYHPMEWSPFFAEQVLQLLKKRRGEFLKDHPQEELKFFWLEYGSIFIQTNRKEK